MAGASRPQLVLNESSLTTLLALPARINEVSGVGSLVIISIMPTLKNDQIS
jgi:hypothetical protein